MSITAQTTDTTHHLNFFATSITLVLRMNQCAITIKNITTLTLIISMVGKSAAPFVVCPNIDESIRHAVGKSSALKKTHVTLTRKKVNNAPKKLLKAPLLPRAGAIEACTTTGTSKVSSGG